jgi:hypothetical protein
LDPGRAPSRCEGKSSGIDRPIISAEATPIQLPFQRLALVTDGKNHARRMNILFGARKSRSTRVHRELSFLDSSKPFTICAFGLTRKISRILLFEAFELG